MIRKLALTTALCAMALPAFAAIDKVKEVDVTADITAIQNPEAAAYWGKLADDIEAAVLARITDRIADDGAKLSIDINELSLSNAFTAPMKAEDGLIVGQVNVTHDSDNSQFQSYELTVSVNSVITEIPEGTTEIVFPSTPETYAKVVDYFADNVVERLDE